MTGSVVIHTPVDVDVEREAAAVLAELGLTVAEAVGLMLKRVVADRALPFESFIPNAETVAAMRDARAGGLKRFDTLADLMSDLHADDRTDDTVQTGCETRDERTLTARLSLTISSPSWSVWSPTIPCRPAIGTTPWRVNGATTAIATSSRIWC